MLPGNEKFRFEQVTKQGANTIMLIGGIDEDTHLESLVRIPGPLVFNWSQVTTINSCGVRSWVNFLKEIINTKVSYSDCPPLIVRQMNMVPSFVGHAEVLSIYVPYVCDNCDAEKVALVRREKFGALANMDEMKCESCGKGVMELDGHPQQYIAFHK